MKRFAEREILILTAVTTLLVGALTLLTTGGDWAATLLTVPLVASIAFWSLIFARRIGARWAPKPPPPYEPPAPSSERPEHAQRRRQRRAPRGRRGPGEG